MNVREQQPEQDYRPEGRQRVICGKSKCRDDRYRRLHPEAYAAKEARKVERRRLKRREAAS